MSYTYIEDQWSLDLVLADLKKYKETHFPDKRMKLGFDLETYWSDPYYAELAVAYTRKPKTPVPRSIRFGPGDDDFEGLPRLFSIGLDPTIVNRQYIIDVMRIGKKIITQAFKKMFENDAILIGQNIAYDLSYLALQFNIYPPEVRDTMLIGQLRWTGDKLLYDNSEASFSLAALYDRCIPKSVFIQLTGMDAKSYEVFKHDKQTLDWSKLKLDDTDIQYAADDVRLIFYVYDCLIKECNVFKKKHPKSGLLTQIKIECAFALEVAIAECVGIGTDPDYHKNIAIPFLEKLANDAVEKLVRIPEMWVEVKGPVRCPKTNPWQASWCEFAEPTKGAKLGKALAENLGLNLPKTEKSQEYSVAGNVLNEFYWESEPCRERDILELVIQAREAQNLLSKAGETLLKFIHDNGRIHANIYQRGTEEGTVETGRMAIRNPALHNIPNEGKIEIVEGCGKTPAALLRPFFVALPGIIDGSEHVLIDADASNEEVRFIAVQSGDKVLQKAFNNDEDLHQKTADNLGVSRPNGKLFFLSSQYGAYPKKIMRNLYEESRGQFKSSLEEVTELREKHFKLYSGLAKHIEQCAQYVESQLAPHETLCDFANRKPIIVGFTPSYGAHRLWCLSRDQELKAHRILKEGKQDTLHRDIKVLNKKTGKFSVFKNDFNTRKSEIIRELFNFYVQGDCACALKEMAIGIGREFRANGWSPYDAHVIVYAHDELLADVRKDLEEQATEIITRHMMNVLNKALKGIVPAKVGINSGVNWYEASPK